MKRVSVKGYWDFIILAVLEFAFGMGHVAGATESLKLNLMRFLQGVAFDTDNWNESELRYWILTVTLISVVALRRVQNQREECTYMQIVRYGKWEIYYKKVMVSLAKNILFCHIAIAAGLLAASFLSRALGYAIVILWGNFAESLAAMFLSNLLFSILAAIWIIHRNSFKVSFLLHPGLVILLSVFSSGLPRKFVDCIPTTWCMVARSNHMAVGGFPLWICFGIEIVLIAALMIVFVYLPKIAPDK